MKRVLFGIAFWVLICGCGKQKAGTTGEEKKQAGTEMERVAVNTVTLQYRDFEKELVSNGKLRAKNKGSLRFLTPGTVKRLWVKNGSRVNKGDTIAMLDDRQARLQLVQATRQLEKARMELEDYLLGFGFQLKDSLSIPAETMRYALIHSGVESATTALNLVRLALEQCTLLAPVSGRIANLKSHEHEYTGGEEFCMVINDSEFEVEFSLLETEIRHLALYKPVSVHTFINEDQEYPGEISEINPIVDHLGQVAVRARIRNNGELMDGMNVKVYVKDKLPDRLVVPKSAVLIRGDQSEVLFRVRGNEARWTYVRVMMENSREFVIEADKSRNEKLEPGDQIIVSGNVNLANGTPIEVINKN